MDQISNQHLFELLNQGFRSEDVDDREEIGAGAEYSRQQHQMHLTTANR